jgi:hypothetical protein
MTPKTIITLTTASIDSAKVGSLIEIPVYAEASSDLTIEPLRYTLRINATMLGIEGAGYDNGEIVISKSQAISLTQTRAEIARVKATVLANQAGSGSWRITDITTHLDTSCTIIRSDGGALRVDPVCVNDFLRIRARRANVEHNAQGGRGNRSQQ